MSGYVEAPKLDQDEGDEKEGLQVDLDQIQDKLGVNSELVENPTKKGDTEKAGIHQENVSILTFDHRDVKSCCVLLCRGKCLTSVEHCRYIKLTISFSVNIVLVALIIFVVARNGSDDSLDKSSQTSPSSDSQIQAGEECRTDSVCVQCKTEEKRHRLTASHLSTTEICCKENSQSLKILVGLITSEKRRRESNDCMFMYFSSFPKKGDTQQEETLSNACGDVQLFPGNKVIVQKSGVYVIFFAVTKTSVRHGNLSINILRYSEKEHVLLSVFLGSEDGVLTYDVGQASEAFFLQRGDSLTIRIKGQDNLYGFKQSNYFGMYRIDPEVRPT